MKTCIFFFTGTGNTLRTVTLLRDQLEKKGELVDTIDISQNKSINIKEYNKIGFIFPIYCLGIPEILKEFINDNHFSGINYLFAVANCGSSSGITFKQINKLLRKDSCRLKLSKTIKNGSNNNLFINIPGTSQVLTKEQQKNAYKKANEEIGIISEYIADSMNRIETETSYLANIKSFIVYSMFMSDLKKYSSKFSTTNDCRKCGLCVKSCPVKNIDEGVKWKSKCQACLRCFTICPNNAIKHGKMNDPRMYKKIDIDKDLKEYIIGK